jgi:hypothetical protein
MGRIYADLDELMEAARNSGVTRDDVIMINGKPVKLRPKIRSHCLPGGLNNPDRWTPQRPWFETHTVQWGDMGVVIGSKGTYRTAFFEVFSTIDPRFVRGEGSTVEEAEADAWQKTVKFCKCQNHEFERGTYRNGAGLCKHCGMFKSGVFPPSTHCTICGIPTYWTYDTDDNWYCEKHANDIPEEKLTASGKFIRDIRRDEKNDS